MPYFCGAWFQQILLGEILSIKIDYFKRIETLFPENCGYYPSVTCHMF